MTISLKTYPAIGRILIAKAAALTLFVFTHSISLAGEFQRNWDYSSKEDPMTGKSVLFASLESHTSYDLGRPYGKVHAFLYIRNDQRRGIDVILNTTAGQLLCHSGSQCRVLVRFDTDPPIQFGGNETSSRISTALFIRHPERFINRLSTSKRVRIEIEFFSVGVHFFEFNSTGFDRSKIGMLAATARKPPTPKQDQSAVEEDAAEAFKRLTGIK